MTDFDTFWKAYPRRVGKLAAMKAWAKAERLSSPDEIMSGLQAYISNGLPEMNFIPHPATWLNQGRWWDEYETTRAGPDLTKYDLASPDQLRQYRAEYPNKPETRYVPKDYGKLKVVK